MTIYKRSESKNWFFKYTDDKGKRLQKSTGTDDRSEALRVAEQWCSEHRNTSMKLLQAIQQYQDPETNPKYQDSLVDGRRYSPGYAKQVARYAKILEDILQKEEPRLLAKRLDLIDKADIKTIKMALLRARGRTRTAEQLLQLIKVLFHQAADAGLIAYSPANGSSRIHHDEQQRQAMDPDLIAWMIQQKDLFFDTQSWAFFVLIATTGIRKGEALAFDRQRLSSDGIYTLDRKVEVSGNPDDLGDPKMGHARIIPLPRVALDALAVLPGTGRLFYQKGSWVQKVFDHIRAGAAARDPENAEIWKKMTAHVLRHSANTNLLVAGVSKLLIATYLAWEKQDLNETQIRYTHLVGKSLQPVADALDRIYGQKRVLKFAKKA